MLTNFKRLFSRSATEQQSGSAHLPANDGLILVNAYCTCIETPPIRFPHKLNSQRDLSDPELFPHLQGFVRYILSKDGEQMTFIKYHTMRHIQRVQKQISIWITPSDLDAFSDWAAQVNAIAFLQDGSVRDANGQILISVTGEGPEPGAQVPYPADALERKERSSAFLAAKNIRAVASLPPVISEREVRLRSADAVQQRAYGLLAVAVKAESLATGDPVPNEEIISKLPPAKEALSPKEKAFFDDPEPTEHKVVQLAWRYECAALLQWALGLVDDLPFPDTTCDVPRTTRTLLGLAPAQQGNAAKLRPAAEILDALDLHFRLHWVAREAQRKNEDKSQLPFDSGVVQERHHALNWLIQFEGAEWDDVDTPT